METEQPPILFIGLDGGEPALIRRWMDEGALPALAQLSREGRSGDVRTLPGMGDGAVWPTLITGVNPARHGRYFRTQTKPGSYRVFGFKTDRDFARPPFWSTLSDAGRRVAILDPPFAPQVSTLNGVLLADWLMHDRYGPARGFPLEFAADVLSRYGDDPIQGNSDAIRKTGENFKRLQDQLIDRVRMKEGLVTETLGKGPWDLVMTAFTEPHDLGHVAWHLHDPGDRRHDSGWYARFGDPIRNLYVAIDAAIGRLVARAGDGATVIIFAGLGMGPNYTANGLMDRILARLDGNEGLMRSQMAKSLRATGKPELLVKLAGRIDSVITRYRNSRRRFFALSHNENSGAIRINLQGREPQGRVKPDELNAVCQELADRFMELKDPVSGVPVVKEVVRVTDQPDYAGPLLNGLPDLFMVWNRAAPFDGVESPRIGRIDGARSWGRSGDHTPNIMLMVKRPGLQPGMLQSTPRIVDIAPTIAALRGVPLAGSDGVPIEEIIATSAG